ncbi:AAA-domain-containing protein [Fomitiporia mediterranea MF3/22]|uniref:AAA-domain-containing protein n=1 Tax=Fomitiporia mediterranea (strain MF3/22) TaxID=694068 RepID=UPI0004408B22|nr:AAA-domain-containing protein [Fomitiporia mediterranea MF3/22]EJC98483.1 AAA-domain-containing protein [Fomitiporia mediterranea MF3/22]
MSGSNVMTKKMAFEIAMLIASQVAAYYTVKWIMESMGPGGERKSAKARNGDILKRLGHKDLKLTEYEEAIAAEVIHPDDIDVRFSDIGGLDSIVSSLRESVIYPLVYPSLFSSSSSLLSAPKGVLLYGPPGCGKTMLARALAKESNATFINIAVSSLTNKWYGESNKLIAGLFGLARKVQPSIIFIDEIDSFLRTRSQGDHEVTAMMKAEFMTLWDGLLSASDRILVLGATNRPADIDAAILRRMPKRYPVGLPDKQQRLNILNLMLKGAELAPNFPLNLLAEQTAGLSGSDLKELCREAAMIPVREFLKAAGGDREVLEQSREEGFSYRPLEITDFFAKDGSGAATPIPALANGHVNGTDDGLNLPISD